MMEPRPFYPSVLHGQRTHRSSLAWEGATLRELHCRRHEASFHRSSVLDTRIIPLLQQTGFYGVAHLEFISLDWHLITSFNERCDQRFIHSTYLRGSARSHSNTLSFFLDCQLME